MTNPLLYWLWLAERPGCSAKLAHRLLHAFGSPEAIWRADREQLAAADSLSRAKLDALADKDLTYARRIADDCARLHIDIVTADAEQYPRQLLDLSDAPLVLYVRGTLPDFEEQLTISVVGTRRATPYGLRAARYFAGNLAQRGCIIVSGMARGIDGEAHRAALEAGNVTVAVLGCGVDVCYPWQHEQLMQRIIRQGAVISEYPPGTEPAARHFPARNRIITGLSRGTLVVEAPKKSGAMISADLALEQGRDVFAVPGDINRPNSAGCNACIREGGAALVQTPGDILACYAHPRQPGAPRARKPDVRQEEQLHLDSPEVFAAAPRTMRTLEGGEPERTVWQAVHSGRHTVDEIVNETALPASDVLTALTILEVGGYVLRVGEGFCAADDVQLPQQTNEEPNLG
ncbi:MAG TPA: DNA-protecting protein DprA [Clostridiales bacterium]|nr:DNA-protecting protein DprA [Clostridiales bacterium]